MRSAICLTRVSGLGMRQATSWPRPITALPCLCIGTFEQPARTVIQRATNRYAGGFKFGILETLIIGNIYCVLSMGRALL